MELSIYLCGRGRGRRGVAERGGCKGSVPLALFVFVGPHSVIRLRNAPRPSSFAPQQPRSAEPSVLSTPSTTGRCRGTPGVVVARLESAKR